jgi:hypothetical protein
MHSQQEGGTLFQGASEVTTMRLSVTRYLMNAQRPMADAVSGNHTSVGSIAMLNARSALAGANSLQSVSSSYLTAFLAARFWATWVPWLQGGAAAELVSVLWEIMARCACVAAAK